MLQLYIKGKRKKRAKWPIITCIHKQTNTDINSLDKYKPSFQQASHVSNGEKWNQQIN